MSGGPSAPLQVNQSWSRIFQDLILRGEIPRIGHAAFAAYAVIKGHSDRDTGIARITHARLGELIGTSERTAIRTVETLEVNKLVEVVRRHRRVNEYRIIERLLVRTPATGQIVGELCWPTTPAAQSAIDSSIKEFRATGVPPAIVRYSRRLRVTEREEVYEVFHSFEHVDNQALGDTGSEVDCRPCHSNELPGDAGVTPSRSSFYQDGITQRTRRAEDSGTGGT